MEVVGLPSIEKFLRRHRDLEQEVHQLIRELEAGSFRTPQALKQFFPSCKIVDGNTVVFKIRGNHFRLSAKIAFSVGVVRLLALEKHESYDRRDLRE